MKEEDRAIRRICIRVFLLLKQTFKFLLGKKEIVIVQI